MNAIGKITTREIRRSLGRFLAIMGIVALGAGFLTGLRTTRTAMLETLNRYVTENAFYDYRVVSTLGLTQADADALASMDGVAAAEGSVSADVICTVENGENYVLRAMSITDDVNRLKLRAGRMPAAPDECVLDARSFGEDAIGSRVTLSADNDPDTLDMFSHREYTVVGLVNSPCYINFTRGTTALGNGTVSAFFCIPPEGFDTDYYTEIYVKLAQTGYVYSDAYDDAITAFDDRLTAAAEERAHLRYEELVSDAGNAYNDAYSEYEDGLQSYNDGAAEYADGKAEAERQLSDAMDQIYIAERKLSEARNTLDDGWAQLTDAEQASADGRTQYDANKAALSGARAELDQGWTAYDDQLRQYDALAAALPDGAPQLVAAKQQLDAAKAELDAGEADYARNEAALTSAGQQLDAADAQIAANRAALESGEADYKKSLYRIYKARADYTAQKADVDQQLDDTKAELDSHKTELDGAGAELEDARQKIDDIEEPTVYVLDRYTNSGYASFESDADIVSGIAKVFPIFFFLVAALVCVTTMNRMVDEQRTQIGVLKALGYTSREIMRGYLLYTGIASGAGSAVGVALGSVIFPKIIWQAYNIMYGFGDIDLVFDWALSGTVCAAFLICSLLVTALSCRNVLREVPAELVRPKTPRAGKRIILEYIPFLWNRFSFLRKVSARNIFRYKKRMAMMILGIAGCTALLITGFGLDDSIAGLADTQFDDVSIYDAVVSFESPMDAAAQQAFLAACGDSVTDCAFMSMCSVDALADGRLKSVYLVGTDEKDMSPFMNFRENGVDIPYPGPGEVIINNKLAELCGLRTGDKITLRNSDMKELTLTVSGVFFNVVYNYAYVSMDTLRAAEGFAGDVNVAYVNLNRDAGLYESAAAVAGVDGVASVKVNDEVRDLVNRMLASMKYIVALVIFCAGALALIVLYNLTNININERLREIATIKVLGFNQRETASYVFRENIVLTLMGAAVGVPLGIWLHRYVMSQVNIDMISFNAVIHGRSYLMALALTAAFAVVVEVFLYFRLDRINMAESLKSVE